MNENSPAPERRVRQGMDYGETEDVQQVHAAIQREKREPHAGLEPLSLWLIAIYGLAIFFGGAYLGRYSGSFSGDGLDPFAGPPRPVKAGATGPGGAPTQELSQADRGKKIYSANCAVCHQPDGLGAAGQGYPPLAGSEWVDGGTKRLGMIVLKGLQGPITVKGVPYGTAVMQPWDKTLSDAKIADVLTYIRQAWGNKGGPVTPEGVAALRKELANHPDSFTEPELKAVPDDANLSGGDAPAPKPDEPPPPPKA
ncbi:MAG TPA: cytochrome c [Chthoniobacterales bacterium]|nr:cytochrome c [Chthoniobacterales bacterium]